MSRFWPTVCCIIAVTLAGFALLPKPMSKFDQGPPSVQAIKVTLLAVMMAVAWAICFRAQIERRRVSLVALLWLVAMEALLFGAMIFLEHHPPYTW
jgi:hypothetical protein